MNGSPGTRVATSTSESLHPTDAPQVGSCPSFRTNLGHHRLALHQEMGRLSPDLQHVKPCAYILIALTALLSTGDPAMAPPCMCSALNSSTAGPNQVGSVAEAAESAALSITPPEATGDPEPEPAWCVGTDDPRCNPRHTPVEAPQFNALAFVVVLNTYGLPESDTEAPPRLADDRLPRCGVRSRVDRPPQV